MQQIVFWFALTVLVCGVIFFFIGFYLRKFLTSRKIKDTENYITRVKDETEKEIDSRRKEAEFELKDWKLKATAEFDESTKTRKQELLEYERRLAQKETNLDKRLEYLDKKIYDLDEREKMVKEAETKIDTRSKEIDCLISEEKRELERISGVSSQEAKKLLLEKIEDDVKHEAAIIVKQVEDETRETSKKRARNIVGLAIQKYAAEHVVETTVSVVHLPNDEMKGRIIGREGRNIRAFESATGIDVIIDDTPEAVIISGFNKVRREIARISLEKLISDGRIHPARIEEVVEKTRNEIEEKMVEDGQQAALELGLRGMNPELIRLMGRLKYRTSYGQNILRHSKEIAYLMGTMAGELGVDIQLCRRAGFLHDIGKAVDHEVEGSHAVIGGNLCRKYGEIPEICNAVASHHGEEEPETLMAVLVAAADAMSAARPGARRDTLEAYIKRMAKIEQIAESFRGIEKVHAIQAGREIRVVVKPDEIGDPDSPLIARNIAKKLEEEVAYPGQIKVVVIRETRSVEYAK